MKTGELGQTNQGRRMKTGELGQTNQGRRMKTGELGKTNGSRRMNCDLRSPIFNLHIQGELVHDADTLGMRNI
jgi:hypothetical protein